jgi:hypothetical protein
MIAIVVGGFERVMVEVLLSAKLIRNDAAGLSFTKLVEVHSSTRAEILSKLVRVIVLWLNAAFE